MDIVILLWSSGDTRTLGPCLENRRKKRSCYGGWHVGQTQRQTASPQEGNFRERIKEAQDAGAGGGGIKSVDESVLRKEMQRVEVLLAVPLILSLGGRGRQISSLKTSLIIIGSSRTDNKPG